MPIQLKNAPKFGVDDDATVTNFTDKILTCKWQIKDPQLQTFVNRQIHRYFTHAKRHKQRMLFQLFTASSKGKGNSTSLRIRYTTAWNEATQRDLENYSETTT